MRIWDITFCVILAVAHVGLTSWLRPPCVATFDMAIAVDGGYRIYCGQLPYRDFHIPTGPARHYPLALCFAVMGGFSWSAVILCGGLIGSAASVLVYYVLRTYCGRSNALLFSSLTALTFNLPVAFPWFDHLAFLWALVATTALAAVHAVPEPSRRRVALGAATSGVALTLAVMTKQNIGGAALVFVGLLWLAAPLATKKGSGPFCAKHPEGRSGKRGLTPFSSLGRTFPINVLAAACCAGAALVSAAAMTAFFELQGDFLQDFFRSTSQGSRLVNGLEQLGTEVMEWPHRQTMDVWTLLLSLPYLLGLRLTGVRLTRRQGAMALMAGVGLLITMVGRHTGSAPKTWFCGFVPLALGLLAGIVSRPGDEKGVRPLLCEAPGGPFRQKGPDPFFVADPAEATVPLSPRLARELAGVGGLVLAWQLVPALVDADWSHWDWALDLAEAPFHETSQWLLALAIALYFLVHIVRLGVAATKKGSGPFCAKHPENSLREGRRSGKRGLTPFSSPRSVRLGLPSLARTLVFVAVATLATYYLVYNVQRLGWNFSPAWAGPRVPFTKIPALAGCEASAEQVADFEELYAWWQSHRAQYPDWRDGQDLYIMPVSQQFYGLLGVESFRNVRLWYDPGLTFSGTDPDTDQLEAALPALIIVQKDGRPYQFWWSTAVFLTYVPRLQQLMQERYEVLATLQGFEIWGRKH